MDLNDRSAAIMVRVPAHVVYRSFVTETVVLNLSTGKYHGLNQTAGRMLEVLESSRSVAAAVGALAREYDQPPELVERDCLELCTGLAERGLVELGPVAG